MTYFIVAIVLFLQPGMQTLSVMQIPYSTEQDCKQAIIDDGLALQNDVIAMYPKATRFSLVCIDQKTVQKIINEMQTRAKRKNV